MRERQPSDGLVNPDSKGFQLSSTGELSKAPSISFADCDVNTGSTPHVNHQAQQGESPSEIGARFSRRASLELALRRMSMAVTLEKEEITHFPLMNQNGIGFAREVYVYSTIEPHNGEEIPVFMEELEPEQDDDSSILHKLRQAVSETHWAARCLATIVACFLTYSLINQGEQIDLQIAIMIVIVLAGATFPQLIAAAACGAFAGGQHPTTIPSYSWLLLLSCVTAITWLWVESFSLSLGFSGRLGTTTFLAMNITMLVFLGPSGAVPWSQYGDVQATWEERLTVEKSIVYVVSVVFLASLGGAFRLHAKLPVNPVLVPCTLALFFMMIVNGTEYENRSTLYNGYAVGAYVAMASEARLPSIAAFAIAGTFAGLWGLILSPYFLGFGGKSGFTAMIGYSTYYVLSELFRILFQESVEDDQDACNHV